jgi:LmbE family N-acetylglucosaminyl deacetylase
VTDGRVTPEHEWLASPRLHGLPEMDWGSSKRAVIVAPHPDDETLGVGGTLAQLAGSGWRVTLIAVTDGGASHPRSPTITPSVLCARRAGERLSALARLGLANARVVRLEVADGAVADCSCLEALIAKHLTGGDWCLSPWRRDGHPDHDATGEAAVAAAAERGAYLAEYPVWAWHWAAPASDDLPWGRARRVPLSVSAARAKHDAIAAHVSQIAPLSDQPGDEVALGEAILAHFRRDFEVVFV